ncbi:MAG: HAD family hydrolase [Dysgonamonadaceae bacterium]|jgi:hydroxymethylpyrimidine pyrophosphatase-like HAD family hydrolase|nr:HAD family hydrolase [Dysgonamonadaceae bacterium]
MIIAVDFDGTIVEHAYPLIGKPIPFAIDVLKKLQQEEHHFIILWTVREGDLLQEAVNYCEKQGLKFYAVNSNYPEEVFDESISRKINADLYIDDKNIGGFPDWGIIYKMIKSGSNNIRYYDEFETNERPKKGKNFLIRLGETLDMVTGRRY